MYTITCLVALALSPYQEKGMLYEQALSELLRKESITSGTIHVEYNPFLAATLPAQLNNVTISYVYSAALDKLKGRLTLYRVIPAHIEQGRLVVTIIKFEVTRKGENIDLINVGGGISSFTYDCGTNTYHLEKAADESR